MTIKHSLLSELAEPSRLRFAADGLERRLAKKPPKKFLRVGGGEVMGVVFQGDKKSVWTDDAIECRLGRLCESGCFEFEKHPKLTDFELGNEGIGGGGFESRRDWFTENGSSLNRAVWSSSAIKPGKEAASGDVKRNVDDAADYRFYISTGQQRDIEFTWRLCTRAGDGSELSRQFLVECLKACDLEQSIRFEDSEQGFRLASNTLKLAFPEAKWGGYDPNGLRITAPSIATASTWHDRTLAALGGTTIGTSVLLECQVDEYDRYRKAWNTFDGDWQVRVRGGYKPGFDPFEAPLPGPNEEETTYPLLFWDAGGVDSFYQCNLVVTSIGRRLELTTNLSSKKFLERFKNANIDLAFQEPGN